MTKGKKAGKPAPEVKAATPPTPEGLAEQASTETEADVASAYPRQVTIRNNSAFEVAEPESGAYMLAGGSATVTLHDEAHASRVTDNLKTIAERNMLADGLLVIEGLPASNE